MNREPVLLAVVPSPFVLAFWGLVVADPSFANEWPFAAQYLLAVLCGFVMFSLGPIAGFAAVRCGRELRTRGWRSARYALPALAIGLTAFLVNLWCFVFIAGPAC
ncbi:unnamed protein product [Gemmata massiliana]|uniref:Uncharacterized protein n=1 Tax=Gemmata massiliana TaxID=1210884 RepID=A0A6P2CZR6_9BACT|nr:hypothetical protein [Gemmata massiliana]VTR93294.1 unnamed protein product [Gemmata massiliana]